MIPRIKSALVICLIILSCLEYGIAQESSSQVRTTFDSKQSYLQYCRLTLKEDYLEESGIVMQSNVASYTTNLCGCGPLQFTNLPLQLQLYFALASCFNDNSKMSASVCGDNGGGAADNEFGVDNANGVSLFCENTYDAMIANSFITIDSAPVTPAPVVASSAPTGSPTKSPTTAPITPVPVTPVPVQVTPVPVQATPAPIQVAPSPTTIAPVSSAPISSKPTPFPSVGTLIPDTPVPTISPAPVSQLPVVQTPVPVSKTPAPVTPAPVTPVPVTPAPVYVTKPTAQPKTNPPSVPVKSSIMPSSFPSIHTLVPGTSPPSAVSPVPVTTTPGPTKKSVDPTEVFDSVDVTFSYKLSFNEIISAKSLRDTNPDDEDQIPYELTSTIKSLINTYLQAHPTNRRRYLQGNDRKSRRKQDEQVTSVRHDTFEDSNDDLCDAVSCVNVVSTVSIYTSRRKDDVLFTVLKLMEDSMSPVSDDFKETMADARVKICIFVGSGTILSRSDSSTLGTIEIVSICIAGGIVVIGTYFSYFYLGRRVSKQPNFYDDKKMELPLDGSRFHPTITASDDYLVPQSKSNNWSVEAMSNRDFIASGSSNFVSSSNNTTSMSSGNPNPPPQAPKPSVEHDTDTCFSPSCEICRPVLRQNTPNANTGPGVSALPTFSQSLSSSTSYHETKEKIEVAIESGDWQAVTKLAKNITDRGTARSRGELRSVSPLSSFHSHSSSSQISRSSSSGSRTSRLSTEEQHKVKQMEEYVANDGWRNPGFNASYISEESDPVIKTGSSNDMMIVSSTSSLTNPTRMTGDVTLQPSFNTEDTRKKSDGTPSGDELEEKDHEVHIKSEEKLKPSPEDFRQEIISLLLKIAPSEVANVDNMLVQFQGNEAMLLATLETMKAKQSSESSEQGYRAVASGTLAKKNSFEDGGDDNTEDISISVESTSLMATGLESISPVLSGRSPNKSEPPPSLLNPLERVGSSQKSSLTPPHQGLPVISEAIDNNQLSQGPSGSGEDDLLLDDLDRAIESGDWRGVQAKAALVTKRQNLRNETTRGSVASSAGFSSVDEERIADLEEQIKMEDWTSIMATARELGSTGGKKRFSSTSLRSSASSQNEVTTQSTSTVPFKNTEQGVDSSGRVPVSPSLSSSTTEPQSAAPPDVKKDQKIEWALGFSLRNMDGEV